MSVVESLGRLGGVATRAMLIAVTSRAEVDRALAAGDVIMLARGRYALANVDLARREAHRLVAAVSWRSAAQQWGWELLRPPEGVELTVPRNRKVRAARRGGVTLHVGDLHASEIEDGVTTRARTLCDCLRALPFDEALAVADSALRHGFSRGLLGGLATVARGPGSAQFRRVAGLATPEAANPFESGLRAIALGVDGLTPRPQVAIYDPHFLGRPDLVDERLGIALEADSFEWHGSRSALRRDARRYDALVVRGWLVLRFAWEDVMFDQAWVRSVLETAVVGRADQVCPGCRAG